MSNEAIRETIVLNRNIGRETTQVLLEGELLVPDVKPDMALLLQTEAVSVFDKTEAGDGRIAFAGRLQIRVLYAARGEDSPVHSMNASAGFDDFVNMEGVSRDMWAHAEGRIADMQFTMLNDRKIRYRAVLDVAVRAEARVEQAIVTTIAGLPENRLKRVPLVVNRTVECKDSRFVIKDDLPIPPGKPNVREILQAGVVVANKEIKVASGRVSVSGELVVATLYRGDTLDSPLEFVEHELPFSGAVDVAGAREGMFAEVSLHVAEQLTQAKPDADGEDRILDMEAAIAAVVKVTSQSEIQVLEDAYCANTTLALTREAIKYPRSVCRNRSQCTVKELVQLTAECPGMLQICRVTGTPVVDSVELAADRVVAEGVIRADILYIAKNDMPLYHYTADIPFKHTIDARGTTADMDAVLEHSIDHVGFNLLSDNEVELRFLLGLNAFVTEEVETGVVTDVAFREMDRNMLDGMPGMVIYVVQKGDTLWSIAKRFNADLDELIALNDIDNPDLIHPGQRLIVLKKLGE